jgi:hypothetical protein
VEVEVNHFPNFPAESGVGYVYFAKRGSDLYKIGQCENLEKRKKSHKTTDSDFTYDITRQTVEFNACESFLKAHFEEKRKTGTKEEFYISASDIEDILPKALHYADALHRGRPRLNELRSAESAPSEIAATEEFLKIHARLKNFSGKIAALQSEVDLMKLYLVLAIGSNSGITNLISYISQPKLDLVKREELAEILKVERPDLYGRFWQKTTTRPLRIL